MGSQVIRNKVVIDRHLAGGWHQRRCAGGIIAVLYNGYLARHGEQAIATIDVRGHGLIAETVRDVIAINHNVPSAAEITYPEMDGLVVSQQVLARQIHEKTALRAQNVQPYIVEVVAVSDITIFIEFAGIIALIGQPAPLGLLPGDFDLSLDQRQRDRQTQKQYNRQR